MEVRVKNLILNGTLSIAVSLPEMIRIQRRGLQVCGYNLLDRAYLWHLVKEEREKIAHN